ncbi:NAD(P)H-dependent oxidoreductase [Ectothiorhodospira marina]|uniref:NAD(P)H-dependent oxidoreductase n=1 Tax=Ectothiorhodospira marina TaxID=1396821 RepID=UPI000B7FD85B|nr:NAD(P)H-dependent oxidoreductase [Ectothiorhodospira marina]
MKHITLIQGHPDPAGGNFCHQLADAYLQGAAASEHAVEVINVAQLEFPLLRSRAEFHGSPVPNDIARAQTVLANAEHLVFIYPIWMGTMPALLKGFLEQAFRPGVAVNELGDERCSKTEMASQNGEKRACRLLKKNYFHVLNPWDWWGCC